MTGPWPLVLPTAMHGQDARDTHGRDGRRGDRDARDTGFTLLEIVLAISLVVLLSGIVYAFYRETLIGRESIRRQAEEVFAVRRVMDLLSEELQSAVSYPLLQMSLEGQPQEFQLARVALPSASVYLEVSPLDEQPVNQQPQCDIQIVGFRLRIEEVEGEPPRVAGLERTCLRTPTAQLAQEGEEIETSLLSEHVKFLHAEYFDGTAWVDQWSGSTLPAAVRIRLGRQPLPEDVPPAEYPYEVAVREVALPAGGAGTPRTSASGPAEGAATQPAGPSGGGTGGAGGRGGGSGGGGGT